MMVLLLLGIIFGSITYPLDTKVLYHSSGKLLSNSYIVVDDVVACWRLGNICRCTKAYLIRT